MYILSSKILLVQMYGINLFQIKLHIIIFTINGLAPRYKIRHHSVDFGILVHIPFFLVKFKYKEVECMDLLGHPCEQVLNMPIC